MKIEKVLNNNVVVALDENGAETVLTVSYTHLTLPTKLEV